MTSVITAVLYGKQVSGPDDPYVINAKTAMEGFGMAVLPGAHLIEVFPILRHIPSWVPGASARKLADKYRPHVLRLLEEPYAEVKASMVRIALYYVLVGMKLTSCVGQRKCVIVCSQCSH